jgi:hypothetical protein
MEILKQQEMGISIFEGSKTSRADLVLNKRLMHVGAEIATSWKRWHSETTLSLGSTLCSTTVLRDSNADRSKVRTIPNSCVMKSFGDRTWGQLLCM